MCKIEKKLLPKIEMGLLIVTAALQLPATADAESTITTLSDDTMLHEEAAREQTLAVQL